MNPLRPASWHFRGKEHEERGRCHFGTRDLIRTHQTSVHRIHTCAVGGRFEIRCCHHARSSCKMPVAQRRSEQPPPAGASECTLRARFQFSPWLP